MRHSILSSSLKVALCSSFILFIACQRDVPNAADFVSPSGTPIEGEQMAELTSPPYVPAPVGNRPAKKLLVNLEILEQEGEIANGTKYLYWTFGGTVPGSFIRGRVSDEIEVTLKNHPDNKLPHNIDLHAVTGPGGGAKSSFVAPGHQITFSFKALRPGLYVYHCATAPVGMHIANGMYGLILIEPKEGLKPVDREYYVMQGDFYTKGEYGAPGLQAFDMQKALDEDPDYVVFNGRVGALSGKNSLVAKVGETVRIYMGNGGPNLVSSFHVIGEIFDRVYVEAGSTINQNVQTTLIPAGGAAIIEFKVEFPGAFHLVDHSIFRAFNKGALGELEVSGKEKNKIYTGVLQEGIYQPEGGTIQEMPVDASEPKPKRALTLSETLKEGERIYGHTCLACHQSEGQGIAGAFPPLANSDFLNADSDRALEIILFGKSGEITVNGEKYNSVMPSQNLTSEEVAQVLTYVYHNWGNKKQEIKTAQVEKVKSSR